MSCQNNKYAPYSSSEIDTLLSEPWEISDQPYKLHAAFALCTLIETFTEEDDDIIWGMRVDKKIIDRLIIDIALDFNDAASNHKQIKIWNKPYSIRKVNAYDKNRLIHIFHFPEENGKYTIVKDGIMNLCGPVPDLIKKYEISKKEADNNRLYLRQIIKLAEDDINNGWDKLTDMEIILYCWGLFYNKYESDNFKQFKEEYKDYLYVPEASIRSCFNAKSELRGRPVGKYAFSASKVMDWNKRNSQVSYAEKIPAEEAENYWYDTALNNSFKPRFAR